MTGIDHAYAEEHDLAEAYLAGRLSAADRDAFEAHYFACAACLERLETAEDFRQGMRQAAAEDVAQAAAARLGLFAAFAALPRRHRLALAGVLLLLAALPAAWLAGRNRALQQELATASAGGAAAAAAEQQRAALAARLQSVEQERAVDRRRLAAELARARRPEVRPPAVQPQVNVPLFLLAAVRSGEPEGRAPVNQIPLAAGAGAVVLTAELATVDHPSYRASLRAAGGQEIWQARGLRPDSRDTLVLLLPAGLLPPGDYRLTIEGATDGGGWFAVGAYPLRVVRQP
jgi:Putative zinc-finger